MPKGILVKVLTPLLLLITLVAFNRAYAALVDINTAGSTELQTLSGIGPSKAQAIIDYRTQNGPFQAISDIKNVSGIGDATFAKIKDYITVETVTELPLSDTSSTTATSTEEAVSITSIDTGPPSSHYSFVPLSDGQAQKYTVGAGRDRLGYVEMPLAFKALPNTDDPNADYQWSFGDGGSARGKDTIHSYTYSGTYNVVLNARLFEHEAVARIRVTIVPAEVSIVEANPEYIALKNDSQYEANLYGWRLTQGLRTFDFPKDTIVEPGQTIRIPGVVLTFKPLNISTVALERSSAPIRQGAPPQSVAAAASAGDRAERLAAAGQKLSKLANEVFMLAQKQKTTPVATPQVTQTAAAALAVASSTATSTVHQSWLSTLKRFFLGKK